MSLMQWDPRLETGHPRIDEQHRALVESLNDLHRAMKEGRGKDEVGRILVFLRDYTVTHFRMEEQLMAQSGYPHAAVHLKIHADLVAQVGDLVNRFEKGNATLTLPVMKFLEDWLTNHIQGEDFRLVQYLHNR